MLAATTVYANDIELLFEIGSFNAKLNGSEITSYSYLSDKGNTMVEIRTVSETLGCTVNWYPETREVGIIDDGLIMQLKIDSDEAVVNGSTVRMTEAAVIRNDKTLVPIRFVSESFSAEVGYEHETKTVTVSSMTYEGRIKRLKESEAELMTSYYNAVKSWLMVTDTEISAESFSNVWDSLVNTRVMELLPGRAVDAALCDKYRNAAQMSFSDRYTLSSSNGYMMITSKNNDVSFVYNPKARTLTLDGKLPPIISHSGGGGGGGNSASDVKPTHTAEPTSSPSATDEPSATASPTVQPSETEQPITPLPTATPKPTNKPNGGSSGSGWEDDDKPTTAPAETPPVENVPTAKPTEKPEITDNPSVSFEPQITPPATMEPAPPDNTDKPQKTPPATKEPDTATPDETDEPFATGGPIPGIPDETDIPQGTDMPDETDIPQGTNVPEETNTPEETDEPQETNVPEETDIPQGTDMPDETDVPQEIDEPYEGDFTVEIKLKPILMNNLYMKYRRIIFRK